MKETRIFAATGLPASSRIVPRIVRALPGAAEQRTTAALFLLRGPSPAHGGSPGLKTDADRQHIRHRQTLCVHFNHSGEPGSRGRCG
jgi:hypothetical protein